MPRELKVVVTCDVCGDPIEEGENHSGSLLITFNRIGGARQIDLCAADMADVNVEGLLGLYYEATDEAPLPEPAAKQFPCPLPECTAVLASAQGRSRHLTVAHGTSMAELKAAGG